MKDERTPASTPVVKSKGKASHVTVPAAVARLVKVAAIFYGISRSSLIENSVRNHLRSIGFEEEVARAIGPLWEQAVDEADKPSTFRKAARIS